MKYIIFTLLIMINVPNVNCVSKTKEIVINQFSPRSISYNIKYPTRSEMFSTLIWVIRELSIGQFDSNYIFSFVNEYIVGITKEKKYIFLDGYTNKENKEIILFLYQDCVADSGLIREIVYSMGYDDLDKETGPLVAELIEETKRKAIKHFCGKEYISKPMPIPQLRSDDE